MSTHKCFWCKFDDSGAVEAHQAAKIEALSAAAWCSSASAESRLSKAHLATLLQQVSKAREHSLAGRRARAGQRSCLLLPVAEHLCSLLGGLCWDRCSCMRRSCLALAFVHLACTSILHVNQVHTDDLLSVRCKSSLHVSLLSGVCWNMFSCMRRSCLALALAFVHLVCTSVLHVSQVHNNDLLSVKCQDILHINQVHDDDVQIKPVHDSTVCGSSSVACLSCSSAGLQLLHAVSREPEAAPGRGPRIWS